MQRVWDGVRPSRAAVSVLMMAVRGTNCLLTPRPDFCHLRGFGSLRSFFEGRPRGTSGNVKHWLDILMENV